MQAIKKFRYLFPPLLVSTVAQAAPGRDFGFLKLEGGGQLFQQYYAYCHAKNALGPSNQRQRDTKGKLPPPPLDDSAHAWHQPTTALSRCYSKWQPTPRGQYAGLERHTLRATNPQHHHLDSGKVAE